MKESLSIAKLLHDAESGEPEAIDNLFQHFANHLEAQAHRIRLLRKSSVTLDTSALVASLYIKLRAAKRPQQWQDGKHFLNTAAQIMLSQILDDRRNKRAAKRNFGQPIERLNGQELPSPDAELQVMERLQPDPIGAALKQLHELNPRQGQIFSYYYLLNLSVIEISKVLKISDSTVKRDLKSARLFFKARVTLSDS